MQAAFLGLPDEIELVLNGELTSTPLPTSVKEARSVAGFRNLTGIAHAISWRSKKAGSRIEQSGTWILPGDELTVRTWDERSQELSEDLKAMSHARRLYLRNQALLEPPLVSWVDDDMADAERWRRLSDHIEPERIRAIFPHLRIPRYATFGRRERSVVGIDVRFTPIAIVGADSRRDNDAPMDKTRVVNQLLEGSFGKLDLDSAFSAMLGELQIAFVSFVFLNSFDGFEHWARLVSLLCSSIRLVHDHPEWFSKLLTVLRPMFEELARSFGTKDLVAALAGTSGKLVPSSSTFPIHELQHLSDTLQHSSLPTTPPFVKLQVEAQRFFTFIRRTFNWDLMGGEIDAVLDSRLEGPTVVGFDGMLEPDVDGASGRIPSHKRPTAYSESSGTEKKPRISNGNSNGAARSQNGAFQSSPAGSPARNAASVSDDGGEDDGTAENGETGSDGFDGLDAFD
ncbi:AAR2 protein-domain-containing protein [Hyaloraphidium curvatum]|nr:AAR2 protein-domain-containing protein [Hyaloraphidium curvatum]